MDNLFLKNVLGSTKVLKKATVAIAGCGGLGSNVAVALTRSGVGKLKLIDFDKVESSNLNRQHYYISDIGRDKVFALKEHLININPKVSISCHHIKLTKNNFESVCNDASVLIEAFDKAIDKKWLIESWSKTFNDRTVIGASGLSGVGNFSKLKIRHSGNIIICGDESSDSSQGLNSARVSIVANMQAMSAIEILLKEAKK